MAKILNACKTFLNRGLRYQGCYNENGQFRITGLAGASSVSGTRKRKTYKRKRRAVAKRGKHRLISDVADTGAVSGARKRTTQKRKVTHRSRRYV